MVFEHTSQANHDQEPSKLGIVRVTRVQGYVYTRLGVYVGQPMALFEHDFSKYFSQSTVRIKNYLWAPCVPHTLKSGTVRAVYV